MIKYYLHACSCSIQITDGELGWWKMWLIFLPPDAAKGQEWPVVYDPNAAHMYNINLNRMLTRLAIEWAPLSYSPIEVLTEDPGLQAQHQCGSRFLILPGFG